MEATTPLRRAWASSLYRREDGAPMLPLNFAFEHASAVRLVDLRGEAEATGMLGHVPGSEFVDRQELVAAGAADQPILLLSRRGGKAGEVALELEKLGHQAVAAMDGGLVGWRQMGFGTSRKPCSTTAKAFAAPGEEQCLTLERIREHVALMGSVQWVQYSALTALANTSCVDGREERHIVGAPGGDMGEFVMTLTVLEKMTGEQFDRAQIQDSLLAYLDTFGSFYMHSDTHGLGHLVEVLHADAAFADHLPADGDRDAWREFLTNPPATVRDALMEHMVQPDNVGCGHLKLMMLHGDEYEVRAQLVQDAKRSFMDLLWAGSPELRYVVLYGEHAEQAVVNVTMESEPWNLGYVPVICPAIGPHQIFVNHPGVSSYRRRAYARFHTTSAPIRLPADRAGALEEALGELADRQLMVTLGHLASGLPIFELRFSDQGSCTVMQVGQVG